MIETSAATKEIPSPGNSLGQFLQAAGDFFKTPHGMATLAASLCIGFAFWPLLSSLPGLWMSEDGYYSHGFLVPLISGYIIYRKWPAISKIQVKPGWLAVIPILLGFYILRAAQIADVKTLSSFALLFVLVSATWFVLGSRLMLALSIPIAYLSFALPVWTGLITDNTNPLQLLSTKVAYQMLKLISLNPVTDGHIPNVIYLDNFTLDVGVPCSGMKLLLAVSAFTVFFIIIGGLRWWANLILLAMVLPLSLFINGLRIALIGVVGNAYGHEAGMSFHDYSGYIVLIICFFILFRIGRMLGWKG